MNHSNDSDLIGLFDSGLGGLSVLREVQKTLPSHDLLYVADNAYCPYGPLPVQLVQQRSLAITRWLQDQGAKAIVVACNTATSAAVELLRSELSIPIIGMEPGLKPAIAQTKTNRVGVLATSNTLKGQRFQALIERYGENVEVITQPCPGLVECVEQGQIDSPATRDLLERYLEPLHERGVDVIVLGCTHYPFLRPILETMIDPATKIIDTGPAVARQVSRVVEANQLRPGQASISVWSTGEPNQVEQILNNLLGTDMRVHGLDV